MPLTISCSSKSRLVLPSWLYLAGTSSPGQFQTKGHETGVVVVVVVVAVAAAAAAAQQQLVIYGEFHESLQFGKYTVGHEKCATLFWTITAAFLDGFQHFVHQ